MKLIPILLFCSLVLAADTGPIAKRPVFPEFSTKELVEGKGTKGVVANLREVGCDVYVTVGYLWAPDHPLPIAFVFARGNDSNYQVGLFEPLPGERVLIIAVPGNRIDAKMLKFLSK